jgi:hypothetical protein
LLRELDQQKEGADLLAWSEIPDVLEFLHNMDE